MKSCSMSLIIRQVQVKTTFRYYYISIRKSEIKSKNVANNSEDVELLEYSNIADRNVKWHIHFENGLIVSYKIKHKPTI